MGTEALQVPIVSVNPLSGKATVSEEQETIISVRDPEAPEQPVPSAVC